MPFDRPRRESPGTWIGPLALLHRFCVDTMYSQLCPTLNVTLRSMFALVASVDGASQVRRRVQFRDLVSEDVEERRAPHCQEAMPGGDHCREGCRGFGDSAHVCSLHVTLIRYVCTQAGAQGTLLLDKFGSLVEETRTKSRSQCLADVEQALHNGFVFFGNCQLQSQGKAVGICMDMHPAGGGPAGCLGHWP